LTARNQSHAAFLDTQSRFDEAQAAKNAPANSIPPDGRYAASPMIARIHLGLGEFELALDWLHKGWKRAPIGWSS
jgi:hypothetical protein